MLDPALHSRIDAVLQSTRESNARRYMEEARKCFNAEAYNAAVVMAWCGVVSYFHLVVSQMYHYFAFHFGFVGDKSSKNRLRDERPKPPPELTRINDDILLQTWERMGMSFKVTEQLKALRMRRNTFGHPSGVICSAKEATELIEAALPLLQRVANDEQIVDPIQVGAYLREAMEPADEEGLVALGARIHDDACLEVAHRLLSAYFGEPRLRVCKLWKKLWERIGEQQRNDLWKRLEQAVHQAIEANSNLQPYDLIPLVVWPPVNEINQCRDNILDAYLGWLERLVAADEFGRGDRDFARDLMKYAPISRQARLETILEEMKRRF